MASWYSRSLVIDVTLWASLVSIRKIWRNQKQERDVGSKEWMNPLSKLRTHRDRRVVDVDGAVQRDVAGAVQAIGDDFDEALGEEAALFDQRQQPHVVADGAHVSGQPPFLFGEDSRTGRDVGNDATTAFNVVRWPRHEDGRSFQRHRGDEKEQASHHRPFRCSHGQVSAQRHYSVGKQCSPNARIRLIYISNDLIGRMISVHKQHNPIQVHHNLLVRSKESTRST